MEDVIEQLKKEMREIDFSEPVQDENESIEDFYKRIQRHQEKMKEYQQIFGTDQLVNERLLEYKAKFISKFFDASNLRAMERKDYYITLLMECINPEDRENYDYFSLTCTEIGEDNTKKLRIFSQIKNKQTSEKMILTFSDEDFAEVVDEEYIRNKIQNGMIPTSEKLEKKNYLYELAGISHIPTIMTTTIELSTENTTEQDVIQMASKVADRDDRQGNKESSREVQSRDDD